MATKVSQLFHEIKTFAAEKWEQLVTYYKNWKVAKLEKTEKKLPEQFEVPSTPPTPLSKRSSIVSTTVPPVVNQPEPPPVDEKTRQKQLLAEYTPGGAMFQQTMRSAGIKDDLAQEKELLADYADAVIKHLPATPVDKLEEVLEEELFRLTQAIKAAKNKTPTAPPPLQ